METRYSDFSNLNAAEKVKKFLPDTFLVYLEGEGFTQNDSDMADLAFKNLSKMKLYDLILLWGDAQVDGFKKYKDKISLGIFMQLETQKWI